VPVSEIPVFFLNIISFAIHFVAAQVIKRSPKFDSKISADYLHFSTEASF
jgi:hypothetical protein